MNFIKNIDALILMNDLQQMTQPSSTAVTQGDFNKNQPKNLANKGWLDSMRGKNIFGQEVAPVTQTDLLDIIMSSSPVGASIRGGKVAKSTLEQLLGLYKKHGLKPPKGITAGDLRGKGLEKTTGALDKAIESIEFRNDLSLAKMRRDFVTAKYGIVEPDTQEMVDPVSALLYSFSKN